MLSGDYPQETSAMKCASMQRPTLTDRLTQERQELTARLEKVDAILSGLKANPETQKLLDAISELGGF